MGKTQCVGQRREVKTGHILQNEKAYSKEIFLFLLQKTKTWKINSINFMLHVIIPGWLVCLLATLHLK